MTEGNTCSGLGQQETPPILTPWFPTQPVPQTSSNKCFQFYDRKHRIHFNKLCFSSNFNRYWSCKGIWTQFETTIPVGPGRCDTAQGHPEPARQRNNRRCWEEPTSLPSQALSAPSWASLGWQRRGRWNSRWLKNMHTANSSLYCQLNFPKRISKVFLNRFRKTRARASMADVKSHMACPAVGAQQPWAS